MNKSNFVFAAVLVSSVALADKVDVKNMTDAQRAARREQIREMRQRTTGGYLIRPESQQGSIVFFNCQKSVGEDAIKKTAQGLFETHGFNFVVSSLSAAPLLKDCPATLKSEKADFGVFIIEDANSPYSLGVYPEQRFATVNVSVIGSDAERLKKELYRTIPFLCGGLSSMEPGALMQPVSVPLDIDTVKELTMPFDAVNKMMPYMRSFGVTPQIRRSYKTACQEGWAPQPTNEYQKAIWEKIHEVPSKPVKISYDKDKQKPVVK